MIDRKDVKEGCEYLIDGASWFVWMIHKPGNGEGVTITSDPYSNVFYDRLRTGEMEKRYMQMRKFQREAVLPIARGES